MAISGPVKKEDQAPNYKLTGAAIKPETVEAEVKVAQEVEPEIAKDAQHELDEQQKQNDEQELQAEEAKKQQNARLPDDVKKQKQKLQDAKDQLRKGETEEEHKQRLANEEKLRLQALKAAPQVEGQLAEEAVKVITPKLPSIQANASAANQKRDEAVAKEVAQAEQDKKLNEDHAKEQQDRLEKAQAKAESDSTQFIKGSGKAINTASAQGKKIQDLQAQLAKEQAQNTAVTQSEQQPDIGKAKVGALVTAFNNSKVVEVPAQKEPRRSPRLIAKAVADYEAKQVQAAAKSAAKARTKGK